MGFGNSPIHFDSREVQTGALQLFYSMDAFGKLQYTNYSEIWICIVQFGHPLYDLAVLQIMGEDLPVAKLRDSRQFQVGDWVVAIGNALGLPGGPTVRGGVVSALGRTVCKNRAG